MNKYPVVSVIIPFYNCPYVHLAIESVLKQTYPHIEIIVINDGSTQHAEKINPYKGRIVYREKPNGGVATALNLGIQLARGDYIAWLSSDDLFVETKIETQLAYMIEKNAHICFTNYHIINEHGAITIQNDCAEYTTPLHILETVVDANPINGCTVMMSKRLFRRVGFFDSSLKYTQDYDYWLRAMLKYPLYYLPMTLTHYRYHSQMGSVLYYKDQMLEFQAVKQKYADMLQAKVSQEKNNKVYLTPLQG